MKNDVTIFPMTFILSLCCSAFSWYERAGPLRGQGAPAVAVLLYRKHVVTKQPYIMQLLRQMEAGGLIPLPIFINGVEAHTVVRSAGLTHGICRHEGCWCKYSDQHRAGLTA